MRRPLRREQQQQPTRLVVQLGPELTARVQRYHAESGLLGKVQDSARELIEAALAFPQVEDALLREARLRAFKVVKRDFEELVSVQLSELDAAWARRRAGEGEGAGDGRGEGSRERLG